MAEGATLTNGTDEEIAAALGEAVADFAERLLEERTPRGAPDPKTPEPKTGDPKTRLLKPIESARLLSVSRSYFYDHRISLPFIVELPSGTLRVSESLLIDWIRNSRRSD